MPKQQLDEESRRHFLVAALRLGAFAVGTSILPKTAGADVLGKVPHQLPARQSIYDVEGEVKVNGIAITRNSIITAADHIETGKNGRLVFTVGQDAFLLRANSDLQLSGGNLAVKGLRLLTGALLSVFGKTEHQFNTPTATIGIRGTGLYVESDPELSYVCTCYGTTDIGTSDNPANSETIVSRHHDDPRYITASGDSSKRIRKAPFKNHTDLELTLIEALVGRVPPFSLFDEGYGSPRRY
jgi:hypothetical protein